VFSGSSAAGRPSEDVDSRTIFVSNVRTLTLFLGWEGLDGICLISDVGCHRFILLPPKMAYLGILIDLGRF